MSPENRELLMNNVYIGFIPVSIWEISVDEDNAVSNIDDQYSAFHLLLQDDEVHLTQSSFLHFLPLNVNWWRKGA